MNKQHNNADQGLGVEELDDQAIAELPRREAMTLIDTTSLLGGPQPGVAGTDQLAGQTSTQSSQLAGQSAGQLSDVASQAASDAATADTAGSQPYQPSVSSVAQS